LYSNAMQDYKRALTLDPFIEEIPEKLEIIEQKLKPDFSSIAPASTHFKPASTTLAPKPPLTRADLSPVEIQKLEQLKQELGQKMLRNNKF
jgi:hypothetical protein